MGRAQGDENGSAVISRRGTPPPSDGRLASLKDHKVRRRLRHHPELSVEAIEHLLASRVEPGGSTYKLYGWLPVTRATKSALIAFRSAPESVRTQLLERLAAEIKEEPDYDRHAMRAYYIREAGLAAAAVADMLSPDYPDTQLYENAVAKIAADKPFTPAEITLLGKAQRRMQSNDTWDMKNPWYTPRPYETKSQALARMAAYRTVESLTELYAGSGEGKSLATGDWEAESIRYATEAAIKAGDTERAVKIVTDVNQSIIDRGDDSRPFDSWRD